MGCGTAFFGGSGGEFRGMEGFRKGSSMNILKNTVWSTMSNGNISEFSWKNEEKFMKIVYIDLVDHADFKLSVQFKRII